MWVRFSFQFKGVQFESKIPVAYYRKKKNPQHFMALISFIFKWSCNMASAPTLSSCSSLCTQAKFPLKSVAALSAEALGTDNAGCHLSLQFQWNLGVFQENIVRSKFLLDFLQWALTSKSKPRPDKNSPWFFLIALSKLITHIFQHRWYSSPAFLQALSTNLCILYYPL